MRGSDGPGSVTTAIGRGLAAALAMLLLFAMPVPYVLYEPGMVVPVDEVAAVETAVPLNPDASPLPPAQGDADASPASPDSPDRVSTGVPSDSPDRAAGAPSDSPDRVSTGVSSDRPDRPSGDASTRTPEDQGGWLLTTVYLRERATLWTVIASAWRTDREAHARRSVFQGIGEAEYRLRMGVLMAESQAKAQEAAFRAAGVRYEAVPDGVYVVRSAGRLKAGDRIGAVDGAAVGGLDELSKALRARAGQEIELTVLRDGREIGLTLGADEAGAFEGAAGGTAADASRSRLAGAELAEIFDVRPADPAIRVTIDAGALAGPSAGLALALHIYERIAGESLTGGRRIAATGTIEPSGDVGAVGGVFMKAIAASRAGADLFLVPEANLAEAAAGAEAAGGGMAVAGVNTLEEALSLLRAGRDSAR